MRPARRLKKRAPCVRVRAVCGTGAWFCLPYCSTTRMVYLARRNAVARVGQTMAWVRCALWREGRWWEMGVIRVVRGMTRLHAWGERAVGTAVGRVHGLWDVGGCGPS